MVFHIGALYPQEGILRLISFSQPSTFSPRGLSFCPLRLLSYSSRFPEIEILMLKSAHATFVQGKRISGVRSFLSLQRDRFPRRLHTSSPPLGPDYPRSLQYRTIFSLPNRKPPQPDDRPFRSGRKFFPPSAP